MNELEIFSAALEIASPEERAKYLDQACGDNVESRKRIEELLDSYYHAGSFMEEPAAQAATTAEAADLLGITDDSETKDEPAPANDKETTGSENTEANAESGSPQGQPQ